MDEKVLKKHHSLIDAAFEEFIDKSFDDASLNTILKNANISKGSFYYHYSDKEDLYISIMKQVAEIKKEFLASWMQKNQINIEGLNIFEILKETGRVSLEFGALYPKYYKLGIRLLNEKNKDIKKKIISDLGESEYDNALRPMIENAYKKEELRVDFSFEFIMRIFIFLFTNYYEIFPDEYEKDLDSMLINYDNFIEFLNSGLKYR